MFFFAPKDLKYHCLRNFLCLKLICSAIFFRRIFTFPSNLGLGIGCLLRQPRGGGVYALRILRQFLSHLIPPVWKWLLQAQAVGQK